MRYLALLMVSILTLSGCTSYKSQYVPFRPPEGYSNYTHQGGVKLGAEAFPDKKSAKEAFGFDIKGAGLLPVLLVMENKSRQGVEIVTNQSFLVDDKGNYWPVVPNNTAIDRLDKSTQLSGFFGSGAGKGAVLGAAAGTVLGAALGIVSGRSVGEFVGKGAAIGAAGGAVTGGVQEGSSGERGYRITDDIRAKGLEGKVIPDQNLASGFLFFPAEAQSARELRLQWRERETGVLRSTVLRLGR